MIINRLSLSQSKWWYTITKTKMCVKYGELSLPVIVPIAKAANTAEYKRKVYLLLAAILGENKS